MVRLPPSAAKKNLEARIASRAVKIRTLLHAAATYFSDNLAKMLL
jgi:hypothetical protein